MAYQLPDADQQKYLDNNLDTFSINFPKRFDQLAQVCVGGAFNTPLIIPT